MITNRIKTFVLTLFTIAFLFQNSFGQNTGPMNPEVASFEPFDAPDMVNLNSGDFSYSIPLLNIPTKDGGSFPVNIFYHAGITVDEEASWVGLGWNLNPGGINRSVQGYPDDWSLSSVRNIIYDSGRLITENYLNVSIPGRSLGYQATWGPNKMFEGQVSFGIGFQYGPVSVGLYGNTNDGFTDLSVGIGPINAGLNFKTGELRMGVQVESIGFSIGSNSGASLSSPLGSVSLENEKGDFKPDYISTDRGSFVIPFPLIGQFSHYKKWVSINKDFISYCSGSIYFEDARNGIIQPGGELYEQRENYCFDIFSSVSRTSRNKPNEDYTSCFLFPNYDKYSVASPGLSGNMSPKIFEMGEIAGNGRIISYKDPSDTRSGYLERTRFIYDPDDKLASVINNGGPYFYMDGSTDSYFRLRNLNWFQNTGTNQVSPKINTDLLSDLNGQTFFNSNRKGSGTFIQYFKNKDIINSYSACKSKGFARIKDIDPVIYSNSTSIEDRSNSNLFPPDGIGSIVITNTEGANYHFSLPVYQNEMTTRIYSQNDASRIIYNESEQDVPYAFSWQLTGITGPDYVDANNDGYINVGDYGYWVRFDYGKWTDGYIWRTPYNGESFTCDSTGSKNTMNFYGRKQIYYLNSIQTNSHTAYFIKALRDDGLGKDLVINENAAEPITGKEWKLFPYYDSSDPLGENDPDKGWYRYSDDAHTSWFFNNNHDSRIYEIEWYKHMHFNMPFKHKVLKLEEIIIVKNENVTSEIQDLAVNSTTNHLIPNFNALITGKSTLFEFKSFGASSGDNAANGAIYHKKCDDCLPNIKKSNFKIYREDNVLDINDVMPNQVTNNIERRVRFNTNYTLCLNAPNSLNDSGKLTLNSIDFCDKNGNKIIPPYKFDYYKLIFDGQNLNNYNYNRKDNYGFDIGNTDISTPELVSNQTRHNWSLKSIEFPLGGKINVEYENDTYDEVSDVNHFDRVQVISLKKTGSDTQYEYVDVEIIGIDPNLKSVLFPLGGFNTKLKFYGIPTIGFGEINVSVISAVQTIAGKNILKLKILKSVINLNSLPINTPSIAIYPYSYILSYYNFNGNSYYNYWNSEAYSSFFPTILYGGGIRVKSVCLSDEEGNSYKTKYYYNYPGKTVSSGQSYSTPSIYYSASKWPGLYPNSGVIYRFVQVANSGSDGQVKDSTCYEFAGMDIYNNQYTITTNFSDHNVTSYFYEKWGKIDFYDKSSIIGKLKKMIIYNALSQKLYEKQLIYNTDEVGLGTTQESFVYRKYWEKDDVDGSFWNGTTSVMGFMRIMNISCSKTNVPARLVEVIEKSDERTVDTKYLDFDIKTGKCIGVQTEINGIKYYTRNTPAHTIYSNMDSKLFDSNNKNMLTQEAASYSSYTNPANNVTKYTGAAIQTWKDIWNYREFDANSLQYIDAASQNGIWRKSESWVWKGALNDDGSYSYHPFYGNWFGQYLFSFSDPNSSIAKGWVKTNEITKYNHYSVPLETKDVNDNYTSSKMDYYNDKVVASIANSNFSSFAYTGFEKRDDHILWGSYHVPDYGGEVIGGFSGNTMITSVAGDLPHSGKYCISIEGDNYGPSYIGRCDAQGNGILRGKTYRVSVWIHKNSSLTACIVAHLTGSNNGVPFQTYKTKSVQYADAAVGQWKLINLDIDVPANYISSGYSNDDKLIVYCWNPGIDSDPAYFDDFRVHPVDAPMSSFVYDAITGLVSAILNNENFATFFKYDAAGRLTRKEKETVKYGKQIEAEYDYHFARQSEM